MLLNVTSFKAHKSQVRREREIEIKPQKVIMQKQNLNPGLLISNTMLFTLQQEYIGVGGGGGGWGGVVAL